MSFSLEELSKQLLESLIDIQIYITAAKKLHIYGLFSKRILDNVARMTICLQALAKDIQRSEVANGPLPPEKVDTS